MRFDNLFFFVLYSFKAGAAFQGPQKPTGGGGSIYYVYLLRCEDESLYVGITTSLPRRLAQLGGLQPGGAKYTRAHRPVGYAAAFLAPSRAAASQLEARLKRLSHRQRQLLSQGADSDIPPEFRRLIIDQTGRILMQFLCHPGCSTCKKAREFLEQNGISFVLRDIRTENPTAVELAQWHRQSGLPLRRFFNTSGQLYRELALKDKLPALSEEQQLALLAQDGMLVRRPILAAEEFVLIGFRENEWKSALNL